MALEIAAILDECALNAEWAVKGCDALNYGLGYLKVHPGYNIVVSIGDRNYVLRSDAEGVPSITRLAIGVALNDDMLKTMGKAQCRIRIAEDALHQVDDPENLARLVSRRLLQVSGNQDQLNQFETDVAGHMEMLRNIVETAGPGPDVIQRAIEDHNWWVEWKNKREDKEKEFSVSAFMGRKLRRSASGWSNPLRANPDEVCIGDLMEDNHFDGWRLITNFQGWVHYSAASTPTGNAGQSNYNAANIALNATNQCMRTTCGANAFGFAAQCIGWGSVGGMGMRWKAFASQDIFGHDYSDMSPLQTMGQAQFALGCFLKIRFEESNNQKLCMELDANASQKEMDEKRSLACGYYNVRRGFGDIRAIWKLNFKGKGGGVSMDDDCTGITFHNVPVSRAKVAEEDFTFLEAEEADTDGVENSGEWILPGRRIRIHGLKGSPEMNDKKGTLVEETKPGVWHVRLDEGDGNKLVKVKNMMPCHSSVIPIKQPALDLTPPMCLAGNWMDWYPRNMDYDHTEKCYTFTTMIPQETEACFGVIRSAAGEKAWKSVPDPAYHMGKVKGRYRIKIVFNGFKVSEAKWEAVGPA